VLLNCWLVGWFFPSWTTGAPTLWSQAVTGKTCLVGVIDTGIDRDHPDLKDKVVIHRDYVGDNIDRATEWNPHGTHVAGTIAGTSILLSFFLVTREMLKQQR
jgi:subtilisin family serine protease